MVVGIVLWVSIVSNSQGKIRNDFGRVLDLSSVKYPHLFFSFFPSAQYCIAYLC